MTNGRRTANDRPRTRQITNDAELDRAIEAIDELLDKGSARSKAEEDRLEELSESVHRYEQTHHPIQIPPTVELFRSLLAARQLTARSLARETGIPVSVMAAILRGERQATTDEARILARYFSLEPSFFREEKKAAKVTFPKRDLFRPVAKPKGGKRAKVYTLKFGPACPLAGHYQRTHRRGPSGFEYEEVFG